MRKTKKRSRRTTGWGKYTFFISITGIMYLCSSLFLRSYNNSLSLRIQSVKSQIKAIEVENEVLSLRILEKTKRERVVAIAEDFGLNYDSENIVTITKEGQ